MLKGRFKTGVTGIALRNGLVFFQFTVTGLLIVATLVVHHQIAFMLSENGGFSKANVITIRDSYRLGNARTAFVNDLTKIPGVIQVSLCSDLPQGQVYASSAMMSLDSRAQRTDRTASVDEQYANTLGLQIVAGRFFSRAFGSDSTALILNEAAVEDFGLKSPLGSRITSTELRFNPEDGKSQTVYTVVGVIKNYHFESMHQRIAPLILVNAGKFGASTIAVLIDRKAVRSAISSIENLWNRADARDNFQLSFLDDVLSEQYKSELASQQILTAFALLAVLIACIGVLGLVMFSTFARAKEISVRKVLGANAGDIIYILSKGYLKLMILATLCSFPISYWAMHRWLEQFAYRIEINAWVFLIATAIITCIVLLTIPFQAVRAALANPVKAMRME